MAGKNPRKIQPGSTIILKGCFSIESLSTRQRLWTQFTSTVSSSTCGQSLGIVSGFYSEKWGKYSTFNQWPVEISIHQPCALGIRLSCFSFPIDEAFARLKYWLCMTKTTGGLILNIVCHVSTNFYGTFLIFHLSAFCQSITEQHAWTKGFWT